MSNFNDTHPELRKDEKFLINIFPTSEGFYRASGWDLFKLGTGKVAYTNTGEIVKLYVPLFGKPKNKK